MGVQLKNQQISGLKSKLHEKQKILPSLQLRMSLSEKTTSFVFVQRIHFKNKRRKKVTGICQNQLRQADQQNPSYKPRKSQERLPPPEKEFKEVYKYPAEASCKIQVIFIGCPYTHT